MSTSVKLREPDKARLDRLQAELVARLGYKITQEELLARLISLGEVEKDRITGASVKPRDAAETWRRLQALIPPKGTGNRHRAEEIDRDIYASGLL